MQIIIKWRADVPAAIIIADCNILKCIYILVLAAIFSDENQAKSRRHDKAAQARFQNLLYDFGFLKAW